jgi:hypothetical protein
MHDSNHPHEHPHEHSHTHAREQVHSHEHSHGGFESVEQAAALMKYMLEHNRHHADELHDVCHKLEDMGRDAAAEKLGSALEAYNRGNDALAQALAALEEA